MLRLRLTSDAQPRAKNAPPPHSTVTLASSSSIQRGVVGAAIAIAINAALIGTVTQKRSRIDCNSGLASGGPAVVCSGSSAMPHLGQAPDLSLRTSGCIGQVHSVPALTGAGAMEV